MRAWSTDCVHEWKAHGRYWRRAKPPRSHHLDGHPGRDRHPLGRRARPDRRGALEACPRRAAARQGRRSPAPAPPGRTPRSRRARSRPLAWPTSQTTQTTRIARRATPTSRSCATSTRTRLDEEQARRPPISTTDGPRQPIAKNRRASHEVSPSTLARVLAHPPRALRRSTSASSTSSSPGRTTRRHRTFSTPPNRASFPS